MLVFLAALMDQWENKEPAGESPNNDEKKPRVFGIAKGMATISKNFDEPLNDFKEYME